MEFAVATEWPQGGQVVYRRRSPQDGGEKAKRNGKGFEFNNSWVVPYNPFLLLKYNCHINVESCNSLKAIKYLFKYLFKGSDRARVKFEGDEIQYYLDCRYVGVCEAFWRLFQYEMHSSSHTIYRLQIHLPDQQLVHYKAGAEHEALERARNADTMLTGFFKLNAFERQREEEEGEEAVAPGLLYQELAEHYVWHKQPREWRTRERGGIRTLARMPVVTTKQLELFFLRILLQHVRGPECFEDLRTTPDGTLHPTFQEAARALGLFQDDEEYEKAMREACRLYRPKQRRQLFASILTECEPLEPANLWHKVKEHLADDYVAILSRRGHPEATLMEAACNWALYDIKIRVESRNCYLQSINMPMPSEPSLADIAQHFATVGERTFDRNVEAEKLARDLHKLNTTQREIFDRVKQSLETQQQALLFVEGAGGTGKTFMFRLLCNLVRSRGETVLPCAYSGIAAKNYEGGSTFHFRFKFGVPFNETSTSGLSLTNPTTKAAALFAASAVLLLGDEASTIPMHMVTQMDEKLKGLRGNYTLPFGGMNIVLCGDFCQTLPILPQSLRNAIIRNCIVFHQLWHRFAKFRLEQNMRVNEAEVAFKEFLGKVGRGELPRYENLPSQLIRLPQQLILQGGTSAETDEPLAPTEEDLIAFVYGEPFDNDSEKRRAILCPLNVDSLRINETCLQKCPGKLLILNASIH